MATTSHVVLGAGPVGRAVISSLTARGITPTVVTRTGQAVPGAISLRADLGDPSAAAAATAGAEVLFQCAQPAYHRWPQEFRALQSRVVDAAAEAGALLVAAENVYGYGPVSGPLTEVLPLAATTRKGRVRAQMWRDLADAHQAGRLRVVAGRASDFFGPGVTASAVGDRFFGPLCRGERVDVVGDPDRLHAYTYVPDFGEALVRLSETPATWGHAWHVPNATTVTTREFATIAAGLAAAAPLRLRPVRAWQLRLVGSMVPAVREIAEMLYEFDEDHVVDHTAYTSVLGDHATPLEDAVAATVAEYTAPRRHDEHANRLLRRRA
ncbi:NAD-dependent epimerase/dehydratase family protein [Rhodococcus koreensis]|uniref:NAD-dependent epimerase/dehydratase family protein n=1 Tax=Rhodococcus koreensis TaxID=99653 RepID=UPI00197DA8CF|nr:NAD-dependent epimerase/dehydratase family protein [Rhodococcus koreensis]QSE78218.1 NAD-dependent epimerase/dehydratase family protein [Rhodococcus koreensis]